MNKKPKYFTVFAWNNRDMLFTYGVEEERIDEVVIKLQKRLRTFGKDDPRWQAVPGQLTFGDVSL